MSAELVGFNASVAAAFGRGVVVQGRRARELELSENILAVLEIQDGEQQLVLVGGTIKARRHNSVFGIKVTARLTINFAFQGR